MRFGKEEAIHRMNQYGQEGTPFLFLIDYEMENILLFDLRNPLPSSIAFSFPGAGDNLTDERPVRDYYFRAHPVSYTQYEIAFREAQRQIFLGNSFLLNLTFPSRIETDLSLREIFDYSSARYKLWIENKLVVFSPEPFVKIRNGIISSNPMKGTARDDDAQAVRRLLNNEKETAEHHTIVDLIRNDLSRVATDVIVKRFRYTDRIETRSYNIIQVSSEIEGKLQQSYQKKIGSLIFELLPAGSVSGAPKPKTTGIISAVESCCRNYYTGICGYFDGKNLDSAVMIRFIEMKNNEMWFRSGGGITHLSQPVEEYNELKDKIYVPIVRKHQSN